MMIFGAITEHTKRIQINVTCVEDIEFFTDLQKRYQKC